MRSHLPLLRFFFALALILLATPSCSKKLPPAGPQRNYVSGYVSFTARRTYAELLANRKVVLVDLRRDDEYRDGHIQGARSIPLDELADRVREIDPDKLVILYSNMGVRSRKAAEYLTSLKYEKVATVTDGIVGWMRLGGAVRTGGPDAKLGETPPGTRSK